jgi:mannonate dehydratase
MRHTWRWFGPVDKVTVRDAAQAGAEGIVSALHHVPTGTAWTMDEIRKRQDEIKAGGLYWDVVESVPVSEDIKTQTGEWRTHVANWQETLRRLSACGIRTVCYNFMPVLDWTRTDLRWETRHGARPCASILAISPPSDIHILKRPAAKADYPEWLVEAAASGLPRCLMKSWGPRSQYRCGHCPAPPMATPSISCWKSCAPTGAPTARGCNRISSTSSRR